jgi:predicted amidohydrolase
MYQVHFAAQASTADSTAQNVQNFAERPYVIAQVDITATATVKVQGRISSLFGWVDLHSFTASGAQQVTAMPQMRFSATITSGTIDAALAG